MAEDLRLDVDKARRGDRDAFGRLVRKYQRRVYFTAFRMMGNHEDAHDVSQEAFIRAYRGITTFDGRSDFFTWLYRIVVNVALNTIRARRSRATVSLEQTSVPEELLEQAGSDPRQLTEIRQKVRDVHDALAELPESLRAALVLVILEEMPYRQAAAILECSEGTVGWRVHEARQRLRLRLARHLRKAAKAGIEDELSADTREALDVRR